MLLGLGEARATRSSATWAPPAWPAPAAPMQHEVLRSRLDAAVRARMMADVPLGAFLSGGIDLGAVTSLAAMAAEASRWPPSPSASPARRTKRPDAAMVAERYGTRHVAEDGAAADYLAMAREIPRLFGEPCGDHSAVPTLAVASLARRHVTVALSGDGGDEVFAGYRRYRFHMMAEAVRRAAAGRAAAQRGGRAGPGLSEAGPGATLAARQDDADRDQPRQRAWLLRHGLQAGRGKAPGAVLAGPARGGGRARPGGALRGADG